MRLVTPPPPLRGVGVAIVENGGIQRTASVFLDAWRVLLRTCDLLQATRSPPERRSHAQRPDSLHAGLAALLHQHVRGGTLLACGGGEEGVPAAQPRACEGGKGERVPGGLYCLLFE